MPDLLVAGAAPEPALTHLLVRVAFLPRPRHVSSAKLMPSNLALFQDPAAALAFWEFDLVFFPHQAWRPSDMLRGHNP